MSDLHILIPAAGRSTRFAAQGYTTPKPFLQIRDRNGVSKRMVDHVADSAPIGLTHILYPAGAPDSSGQAESVLILVNQVLDQLDDARVLVLDCDMVLPRAVLIVLEKVLSVYSMSVAVAETFDPNASRIDSFPFPRVFAEKQPIGKWGIVGARAFRSARNLKTALEYTISVAKRTGSEPYISEAMNYYPGTAVAIPTDDFQDWGTPERVAASGATIVS